MIRSHSPTFAATVLEHVDRIEAELKSAHLWQDGQLGKEQYEFEEAFAMDTMTFAQWLQFIFIPQVRNAAEKNDFPGSSNVGAQAVREFDAVPGTERLQGELSSFDALFR